MNDVNIAEFMKSEGIHDTIESAVACAEEARQRGMISFFMPHSGATGSVFYVVYEMSPERNVQVARDLVDEWLK